MAAAEPSGGSCTRATRGGTSGTVTSITILPRAASAMSVMVWRWAAKGTVTTTISASAAASVLAAPSTAPWSESAAALAAARSAEREPTITR